MILHTVQLARRHIVVCLENQRGLVLVTEILTAAKFAVVTTGDLRELVAELAIRDHYAVVTTGEWVAAIGQLTRLPIINPQEYVHRGSEGDQQLRFDRAAFLVQISFCLNQHDATAQ
ncbi:hypothetical protein [Agrobacterium arsenijevicii]|uniref:Uncharacterized protein n=1 Tax=Agrobacterium arsenijevicii TaxID=1585697 RepID=A0ABR5D3T2_9HYPH|nr:hypothetical protein RP75_19475 [Agrobacterium arsenijevicii]